MEAFGETQGKKEEIFGHFLIMAKTKSLFRCTECGFETPQWLGKCPECNQWNCLEEAALPNTSSVSHRKIEAPELSSSEKDRLQTLSQTDFQNETRLTSGLNEFDRVVGGGLFEGSVTLFSGEPGIGKSTLLLQVAHELSKKEMVLYVSAEESLGQITARAKRLKIEGGNLVVISENNLLTILGFLKETKPALLILDSIQAVYHPEIKQATGSLTQVRDSAAILERAARELNASLMIVGHVTKEGALAGPKVLEHLVDTVIQFEGDRYQNLRTLRASKNRNGPTGEIGLFEMTENGLEEVKNPSAIFMGEGVLTPGRALVPVMEGDRPLIVEVQSLVSPTIYPNPVRRFTGADSSQVSLLVAILEKVLNLNFSKSDIFLKISGGLTLDETACDLGIALAIVSSYLNKELPTGFVLAGELGLGGEVKPIRALDTRIRECERLGLQNILIPKQKRRGYSSALSVREVASLKEAYQTLIHT